MKKMDMSSVSGVAVALFVACVLAGGIVSKTMHSDAAVLVGVVVGLYFLFAIKVVRQWEKVAVLRLGKYVGLRGPGLCHIIPVIETLSPYVDQRVRVANVTAESTLTRDTVPVNVDAIVFWMCGTQRRQSSRWRALWMRLRSARRRRCGNRLGGMSWRR